MLVLVLSVIQMLVNYSFRLILCPTTNNYFEHHYYMDVLQTETKDIQGRSRSPF